MGELDGKVAVITGAGSGMARASAEVFVREGAKVLAADITGNEERDGRPTSATPWSRSAATSPTRRRSRPCSPRPLEVFGRVDAVLNVAGIADARPLAEVTMDHYDRIMDVDLRGVLLGTKHGIKTMLPTGGGAIANWSSTGGLNGSTMPTSVYSAAKAGVIAFTKAAAIEYGTQGIRANAICPGFIETAMSGGKGAAERFPALVSGHGAQAGRPARGGGRAGRLPLLRPGQLHHRRRDPRRRRPHGARRR